VIAGIGAAFRAEAFDLLRHPRTWVGALAVGLAAWGFGSHDPLKSNGYVVFESAFNAAGQVASFFLLAMGAVTLAGERTRGTVRWTLPRPVSRAGFVLGKACALVLMATVFLGVAAGASWLVAKEYGFGDVAAATDEADEDGFEFVEKERIPVEFQAATMRKRVTTTILVALPALLTATGIGLLVSSVIGSAAGAVIVAIAVALPCNYLPELINLTPAQARLLPFRAASMFLDQLRDFGRHLSTAEWPQYGGAAAVGALVAVLGLPGIAAFTFSRVDITD